MGRFNLDDYQPVDERIHAFYADHPDGKINTHILDTTDATFIVKADVWREYTYDGVIPDATGFAREVIGEGNVNKTSALENCETSAIGRALANLGYSPKGKRPSREEMERAVEDDELKFMYRFMRMLAEAAGDKKLAKDLWNDAATDFGYVVGEFPGSRENVEAIYNAARVALDELRSMKVEKAPKADPGELEFEVPDAT